MDSPRHATRHGDQAEKPKRRKKDKNPTEPAHDIYMA
jgi:hypothetical protein